MAVAPLDFLSTLEAQVQEHWESTRAAHASIAEHIGKKDLEGLMTYDKEDPHGILALAPDALKPCADVIRGFGEAAVACAAEFEDFVKTAQGDLGTFQESCDAATHTELDAEAACLRSACQLQMEMVQSTKSAIEKMDGLSLTGALLLSFDQYRVDQMDDEAKVEQYEKMQKDLHLHHAQQAQTGIQSLLQRSQIPWLHDFVDATQQDQKRLQDRANATAAKLDVADTLCTGLEQQQAELRDKIQKCAQIRRVTIRAEETNRKKLEETEKARQTAWKEYQNACLRNEAATIMEAKLQVADEATTEELEAAKAALGQTRTACQQCAAEAATCSDTVDASIQASHASLLAFSIAAVKEAWGNVAFALELGKCLLATKREEHAYLVEEQRKFQKLAQKQKQPKMKAQTLEKVERLGGQISEIQGDCAELEALTLRAEDQFNSFRVLKSGLDEEAITRTAQDGAAACYGSAKLYVSDDDSEGSTEASAPTMALQKHMQNPLDKLRIEMEEKLKTQKQQLLAEFQLEKQQLLAAMREELRAREDSDASSLNSFEPVEEIRD